MSDQVREWLLAYPSLHSVSALVADAAAGGYFDLREAIAEAVAADVRPLHLPYYRAISRYYADSPVPRKYHRRMARMNASRKGRCYARLVGGTAVLAGTLARGVGIWQTRRTATIHFMETIPATIANAIVGMRVKEVVATGRVPIGDYPIAAAEADGKGLTLWLRVPVLAASPLLAAASPPCPQQSAPRTWPGAAPR